MSDISPLAPAGFPELPQIEGVVRRCVNAGFKNWQRADLSLIELPENTSVAGLLTRSKCPSPEVEWCREALGGGTARALVVCAGNANAFTGKAGRDAVSLILERVSSALDCAKEMIFTSATGVIGVPLPLNIAEQGLADALASEPVGWQDFAHAICTTDTFAKAISVSAKIGDQNVDLVGVIKGSGMIAPDMVTMLGYIFTDAAISPKLLQQMLTRANRRSFSCITVDSDSSTSDTVLAFATGTASDKILENIDDPGADAFYAALEDLCIQLAHLVVRDGEGASKFIAVNVIGATSDNSAQIIAKSIANSPLVKTAIAGEDANWGRVVMAVGKAGEPAERDLLSIRFGGIKVAENGMAIAGYDEAPIAAHLQGDEIEIEVDLGLGQGRATIWTCDLTHGYIRINADYRS